jgi:hypothetical protein
MTCRRLTAGGAPGRDPGIVGGALDARLARGLLGRGQHALAALVAGPVANALGDHDGAGVPRPRLDHVIRHAHARGHSARTVLARPTALDE